MGRHARRRDATGLTRAFVASKTGKGTPPFPFLEQHNHLKEAFEPTQKPPSVFHLDLRTLPKFLLYIIYALMILIGLVAMYSLLNTGRPDSLLRPLISDPRNDFYVAVVSSLLVFILGFLVFFSRDREGFRQLVQLNAEQIRGQRKRGKSDEEIANAILAAMGSTGGYKHNLARKKLVVYLAEFE